jgi:hypothetical protein
MQHQDFFERNCFKRAAKTKFSKKSNDLIHEVSFGPIRKKDGIYHTLLFSLIYRELNKLQKETTGTRIQLARTLFSLRNKGYGLWFFGSLDDLREGKDQIEWEITQYGFPFFDKFESSDDIYDCLKKNDSDFKLGEVKPIIMALFMLLKDGKNRAREYIVSQVAKDPAYLVKCDLNRIEKYLLSKGASNPE